VGLLSGPLEDKAYSPFNIVITIENVFGNDLGILKMWLV
jgi:hypothetical protein